jgi:hypothetical protein
VLADVLEGLAEAEKGDFNSAVKNAPAELPGEEDSPVILNGWCHKVHQPV